MVSIRFACAPCCGVALSDHSDCKGALPWLFFSTTSSLSVFQAPHEGHLPAHFTLSLPHWEQKKVVFSLAFLISLMFNFLRIDATN